jgi:hypothetical protein
VFKERERNQHECECTENQKKIEELNNFNNKENV